jgi:hypothetical protein
MNSRRWVSSEVGVEFVSCRAPGCSPVCKQLREAGCKVQTHFETEQLECSLLRDGDLNPNRYPPQKQAAKGIRPGDPESLQ